MKKIRIFRIAALCAAAALSLSAVSCSSADVESGKSVNTYELEKKNIENDISVTGRVEGTDIVKITSDLTAKVKTLNVEVGSSVKKGDVLCVFDSSEFQTEYDNLLSSSNKNNEKTNSQHDINQRTLDDAVSDKETAVSKAQRALDNAIEAKDNAWNKYYDLENKKNDYENKSNEYYDRANSEDGTAEDLAKYQEYQQLFRSAEAEYNSWGDQLRSYDHAVDDAQDAYNAAVKNADKLIQSAKDTINSEKFTTDDSTKTQLEKLQEKIDKCTVTAPKSGIITALSVSEGSIPTKDSIMTIEDNSKLKIKVSIKEADILSVHEGQKAVITTSATGDREFNGTVSRVVNIMSEQTANALTGETSGGGYSAEITIDDGDDILLLGMNAKVKIVLEEKEDVFAVPYDAIIEKDGKTSILLATGSGPEYTVKEVEVTKGLETTYLTEISSYDIDAGDLVITDTNFLHDGDKVRVSGSYYEKTDSQDGE
ncbi:MAG: efflux RND transporter periplasmic adaptor subunit [Ruminococcus sp.]|nr:efflux RND transporter periplasmic adaptor subunit [Ruminococcus sp.]